MLDFSDAPYHFFPAKPNRLLMALGKLVNRRFILPGPNHRVTRIDLCGEIEEVRKLARGGGRLLLIANHPSHSDPQLMTEVQRRLGIQSCFMAAYDVFLRSRWCGWLMQHIGCFSIDREGSDRKAMTEASRILKEGEFALTVFPEGNVYLTNDRVTPFLDGAAFLSLKSQKELGDDQPIYAVPISFKFSHLTDVRETLRDRLDEVAAGVDTRLNRDVEFIDELKRIGWELLTRNLTQRGILSREEISETSCEDITYLLANSVDRILDGLEQKIDLPDASDQPAITRIRKVRSAIHQVLADPEKSVDHRVATHWADEAILAFRILQYATPYVAEHPTVDRFSETVERLHEDLTSEFQKPCGPRHAAVEVGEPIPLNEILRKNTKLRDAVTEVTSKLETTIQDGVDRTTRELETPGSELF